jgi:C-terminal processing protease CtpA/Prc
MFELLKYAGLGASALIAASCTTYTPLEMDEASFTRAEVAEDFDAFLTFVNSTHPKLEYSADIEALDATVEQVRQSFSDDMTLRDAWTAMALVNPKFGDAHIGLRRPVDALAAYKESGGALFPAPVVFDGTGAMLIAQSAPEGIGVEPGDVVLSVNGVATRDIIEHLLPRMRGESETLGRLIMERYFSQYFWITYGGYEGYAVRVKGDRGVRTVTLKPSGDVTQSSGENLYAYKKLTDNVGYLDVTTFEIEYKDQFKAFLEGAFTQINEDGVEALIIDLRQNGGGAHDLSDLLMAYLTDKPFSAISGVTARVTKDNIKRLPPGVELGSVLSLPFQQVITPPKDLPMRFNGKVYALIGALTYSQAISFASTLQDFEIATIVGEETEGPANQSGQVQSFILPNTGLQTLAPIYIFKRASGDTSRRGVIPDVEIADDPLDSQASVRRLIEHIQN